MCSMLSAISDSHPTPPPARELPNAVLDDRSKAGRSPTFKENGLPWEVIDARRRVVIERVEPEIDCGRYPIKRVVGEAVAVEADVFADGHDELGGVVLHRPQGERRWCRAPMRMVVTDRWRGEFHVASAR